MIRAALLLLTTFAIAADQCAQPSPEEMARAAGVKLPAYPWHTANIWWEFAQPVEHFESLEVDITVDRDVPSTYNLYISPVGSAQINGLQFYGGLQTNINGWESPDKQERVHRGMGAIFSRWSHDKKTKLSAADLRMEPGGLCETAGYEGEFASVRKPLAWTKGTWTYRIAKDRTDDAHTWFLCQVKAPDGTTTDIGRLRFEGTDFTYASRHSAFVEVYSTAPLPRSGIPKVNVTFGWPRLNGRKPEAKKVHAFYPDKKPTGSPDCAWVKADGENCRVELGPIFKRDEAQRRHALDAKPAVASAGLRVPAFTAYLDPDVNGAKVTKDGVSGWTNPKLSVSWFGEIKTAGKLDAAVNVRVAEGTKFMLTIGEESREAAASGGEVKFGEFTIAQPGYVRFTLHSAKPAGELDALVLRGAAAEGAHFNLEPRRNAASVHLAYPLAKETEVTAFYNEVTAVDKPLWTFYMACGFSRGYFGMQVNSPTERRIIFSVWDAASGKTAATRAEVAEENHTRLLTKGDGVEAGVFGHEGTGGHSHLVFPWKTGQPQRFVVTAKPDGSNTDYAGYWFHPDEKKWKLIASFRAPKDGQWLRGLHSFSENFGGSNGHLRRKALYGPQWIRTSGGEWAELTEASFSHDPTGKENRLDRMMGVEGGLFFLQHGGFVAGFTKYGERFTRPATGKAPDFQP